MTEKKYLQPDDFAAARAKLANLHGVAVRGDSVPSLSAASDLGNVTQFARPRRATEPDAPPVAIDPEDRRTPTASNAGGIHQIAMAACSLILHGSLLLVFWQTNMPVASTGIEVVTVDVVVGADTAAGVATTPSETEAEEVAPVEEAKAEEKPVEQKEEVPKEVPPDTQVATAEPLPDQAKEPEKKEENRTPSPPSSAASGIGRGSSAADVNYAGLIAARLAHHKQYPAAARNSRIQGAGTVTFTIDGNGRVTSAGILRGTGNAILDKELEAMVQRAAPFPKPPGGKVVTFNVPVTFRLN